MAEWHDKSFNFNIFSQKAQVMDENTTIVKTIDSWFWQPQTFFNYNEFEFSYTKTN